MNNDLARVLWLANGQHKVDTDSRPKSAWLEHTCHPNKDKL